MAVKANNIVLFDMARTRSHLFYRYLNTHPDIEALWHPYTPAYLFGPERVVDFTNGSATLQSFEKYTFKEAGDLHAKALKEANSKGKVFIAKEHCQDISQRFILDHYLSNHPGVPELPSNPTYIPEDVFATLTPVFVIRNPVFSVQSVHVANLNSDTGIKPGNNRDWRLMTSFWYQRVLFDFFLKRDGKAPIVVDGDDTVWRTKDMSEGLCSRLGLDVSGLKSTWESKASTDRPADAMLAKFLETSDESTGIKGQDTERPVADPVSAMQRWADKYGERIAVAMRETVEINMGHYEYLKSHKV